MMAVLSEQRCDLHSLLLSPAWLSLKCKAFPCSPPDQATPPRLYSRSSTKIALLRPRTTAKYLHVTPRRQAWAAHAPLPPWLQQLEARYAPATAHPAASVRRSTYWPGQYSQGALSAPRSSSAGGGKVRAGGGDGAHRRQNRSRHATGEVGLTLGQGAFYASEQDVADTYMPPCGDAAWGP
jgi:hypothetical protein